MNLPLTHCCQSVAWPNDPLWRCISFCWPNQHRPEGVPCCPTDSSVTTQSYLAFRESSAASNFTAGVVYPSRASIRVYRNRSITVLRKVSVSWKFSKTELLSTGHWTFSEPVETQEENFVAVFLSHAVCQSFWQLVSLSR